MLPLIDRAINAFNAKTEQGAVCDALPFAAVYGLLDALENVSTTGIRVLDQQRFRTLMGGTDKAVAHEVNVANDVLIERGLMVAGQMVTSRSTQARVISYMELTDKGRVWAMRLRSLCGDEFEVHPGSRDCQECGTLHRNDVPCL